MRMNVYVPDDLGARIEKVKDKVNWSEVAQHAFEQKLGELAAAKKDKNMNDVVERLRAQKREVEGSEKKAGREEGERWARDDASFEHLRALEQIQRDLTQDAEQNDRMKEHYEEAHGAAWLSILIVERVWDDVGHIDQYFEETNGEQTEMFAQGFIDGALDVFGQVKRKL